MKKKITSKSLELDKQTELKMIEIRRRRYKLFKQTQNLSLMQITPDEVEYIQRKAELYEQLTNIDRFAEILHFYKKAITSKKLLESSGSYVFFLSKVNNILFSDCNLKEKNPGINDFNIYSADIKHKLAIERLKKFDLYQKTHNESLLEISEKEYLYINELAEKIEEIINLDCFCQLMDYYDKLVKKYAKEQPLSISPLFISCTVNLLSKKLNKSFRTVQYSNLQNLEQILGEEAIYNGENVLSSQLYKKNIIPSIINIIGQERFDLLNDIVNNDKSVTSISLEQGVSKQYISQKIEQMRKIIKKQELGNLLEDIYNDTLHTEDALLNTTFIKENKF